MRNDTTYLIQGYTPEAYAALWGCDACYDHPDHRGDGAMFYNFSSENQKRTSTYLLRFHMAIRRQIDVVKANLHVFEPLDVEGLEALLKYVENLKAENDPVLTPA